MNWKRLDRTEIEILYDMMYGRKHVFFNEKAGIVTSKLRFLIEEMDKTKSWEVDLIVFEEKEKRE